MGFNFAGIAINKNVKEEISVLQQLLGKKLTLTDEIYFEDAMSYHKEDNDCDVYFNQNGTLVFLSEPIANSLKNASKGMKVLQFAVSETSMVFVLELSENEEIVREIPVPHIKLGELRTLYATFLDHSDVVYNRFPNLSCLHASYNHGNWHLRECTDHLCSNVLLDSNRLRFL